MKRMENWKENINDNEDDDDDDTTMTSKAKVQKTCDNAAEIPKLQDKFCVSSEEQKQLQLQLDSQWWSLPEPLLLRILWMLPVRDILNTGAACKRWLDVASDDLLWRKKLQLHYKCDPGIGLKPGMPYD